MKKTLFLLPLFLLVLLVVFFQDRGATYPLAGLSAVRSFTRAHGKTDAFTIVLQCKEGTSVCPHLKDAPELPLKHEWKEQLQETLSLLQRVPFSSPSSRTEPFRLGEEERTTIAFITAEEAPLTLQLGKENAYLQSIYGFLPESEDSFLLIPKGAIAPLLVPEDEIFDPWIFADLRSDKVVLESVILTLRRDGREELLQLKRVGPEWYLGAEKADTPFVRELIRALLTLSFTSFEPTTEKQEGALISTIEAIFQFQKTKAVETLTIYERRSGDTEDGVNSSAFSARRGSLPYLFRISELPRMLEHLQRAHLIPAHNEG
jgi:hypothetical protein